MVDRRGAGEPLQYVLGTWAFRTLELRVDPEGSHPAARDRAGGGSCTRRARAQEHLGIARATTTRSSVDLGTGSGAIALSLAAEFDAAGGRSRCGPPTCPPRPSRCCTRTSPPWAGATDAGRRQGAGGRGLVVRRPSGRARRAAAPGGVESPVRLGARVGRARARRPRPRTDERARCRSHRFRGPRAAPVRGAAVARPGGSLVMELAPARPTPLRRALELGYESAEVRVDLAGRPRMLVARHRRREGPATMAPPGPSSAGGDGLAGSAAPVGRSWPSPPTPCTGWPSTPPVPGATEALFAVKDRPESLDLPVLVGSIEQAEALAGPAGLSDKARRLADGFWPGRPHHRGAAPARTSLGPRCPLPPPSACACPDTPWRAACASWSVRWPPPVRMFTVRRRAPTPRRSRAASARRW